MDTDETTKNVSPTEQHQSAADSAPAQTEEENLDISFDDPRLAAELKKSRDRLAKQFADLARHLDEASRIAGEIEGQMEEERN